MNHVAEVLTMPADAIRAANLYVQGETTPYGQVRCALPRAPARLAHRGTRVQPLPYCQIKSLFSDLASSADYTSRAAAVQAFNANSKFVKRGISIVPNKYGIGERRHPSCALLFGRPASSCVARALARSLTLLTRQAGLAIPLASP